MGGVSQLVDVCGNDRLSETWPPAARLKLVGRRKERLARDDVHVDAGLRVIVVFPGKRAFGARLLSDTALLRRQSIDRLLRLSILHNEPPILCLSAERIAVSSQGTCIVCRHRSADEVFQCAASIVSITAGALLRRSSLPFVHRGELRDLPYLDRSGRSRDRRDHQFPIGRVTRPGAAAARSGRMQIAWPSATTRCTQFSLSVRKRGDRADFDKMYARYTPRPHGRTRMIVFPLRRSVRLKAATALSRVAMLPMFVRSRPSRTRWTI